MNQKHRTIAKTITLLALAVLATAFFMGCSATLTIAGTEVDRKAETLDLHSKGISDTDISNLNLPTAVPYVFEFDDRLVLVKDYYLGNPEEIRKRAEAVAKQGMAKK